MATTTFGRAAHATRRAATTATETGNSLKFVAGLIALGLGWTAVIVTSFSVIGRPMPIEQLVVALSALISGTIVLAVWSRFGNALLYSIFCAGRAAEREVQRRSEQARAGSAGAGVR